MLTELLSIVERLIKLKEHRERRQSKRFDTIIEPVFNELLLIHADYIKMFEKVYDLLPEDAAPKQSAKYERKLANAAQYLSEKRLELEPFVAKYLNAGTQKGLAISTASAGMLERIENDREGIQQYASEILNDLRLNWSCLSEEYSKLKIASAERE